MEHQRERLESDYFLPTSKITDLINNVTRMLKNPAIESDLSQVLDEFLEKLGECDKYLQNGIFNMNFAEAALFLQSSADLYSKKVDLLWDIIFDYQKRMLLSEDQNGDKEQELEKVEERKRKYKRKRKTNVDDKQTAKLVNNFSFGQAENVDYLDQHYETVDLSKEWSKFELRKQNDISFEHVANKTILFPPNDKIYTDSDDYIGRYDQFHSTSLIEDIFHLEEQKLLADDFNCVINMRIDTYVVNDFLLENSIPTTASKDSYTTELNQYVTNFVNFHKNPEKNPNLSDNVLEQIYRKKSVVCLERLPANILRDKIRRVSLADSLFGDDNMSTVSDSCPSPCDSLREDGPGGHGIETFDQIGGSLENRSKSCSQDSAFYEDGEDQMNNEGETDIGISIDGATVTHPSVLKEIATSTTGDLIAVYSIVEDVTSVVDEAADSTSSALEPATGEVATSNIAAAVPNSSITEEPATIEDAAAISDETDAVEASIKNKTGEKSENTSTISTRRKVARKWDLELYFKDEWQEIKKRKVQKRRVSEKVLKKLATGITATYRDFEIFWRMQYKPADGEGVIQAYGSDSDEDEDMEMSGGEEAEENEEVPSPSNTCEETSDLEETQEEVTPENGASDTCEDQEESHPEDTPDLPISPTSALTLPSCSTPAGLITSTPYHSELPSRNFLTLSDTDIEQEERSRKNVRDWRSFILPKISTMENKADFDIHEYGSKIIEPSEIGEERHFKDIVEGKNAAEVARYFIATLQLANTYNVEITGAIPGELANDGFKIKTLSKTKHHELLEEYQAPSEETFRERLERVKALNPKVPLHSTPRGPPPKKMKFSVFAMKKVV